jgi:DNA invertase Pin-like site-specific DNA recombinase
MRQALIYVRVSTEEQTLNHSLGHQETVCRSWGQRHGIAVAEVFVERGVSGKDLERPEFARLEQRLTAGDIGWVLVSRLDRLSRSLADVCQLVEGWDADGVLLRAIEDGIDDPHERNNRMFLMIRALLAQYERERILARIVPGLQARAKAGLPLGRCPLGYRPTDTGFAPDPVTAPHVRQLFVMAAAGDVGSRRLAAWLATALGRPVSVGAVARMLTNPVYLGHLHQRVGGVQMRHDGSHTALVELGTFLRIQERLKQRQEDQQSGAAHTRAVSWLGGMARCGLCGAPVYLRREPGAASGRYVCDRVLDGDACSAQPWLQDAADTHTWDLLQMRLLTDIDRLRALVGGAIEQVPQFCDARRTRAQAILDDATREEAQQVEDLAQGTLDQDGYIAARERLETRRGDAQALLEEIDGWSFLARLAQVTRRSPNTMAPEVRRLWDVWARDHVPAGHATIVLPLALVLARLDMSERRRLLAAAIERVELLHGEAPVRVVFRNGAATFAGLGRAMAAGLAQGDGIVVGT